MAAVLPSQALLTRFTVYRHPRHLLIIRTTGKKWVGHENNALGFPVSHARLSGGRGIQQRIVWHLSPGHDRYVDQPSCGR